MTVKRLPRNTRTAPTQLALRVDQETKQAFDSMATAAGLTKAVFFEQLMQSIQDTQLTDRGVPHWMPQPEPDLNELPMQLRA